MSGVSFDNHSLTIDQLIKLYVPEDTIIEKVLKYSLFVTAIFQSICLAYFFIFMCYRGLTRKAYDTRNEPVSAAVVIKRQRRTMIKKIN